MSQPIKNLNYFSCVCFVKSYYRLDEATATEIFQQGPINLDNQIIADPRYYLAPFADPSIPRYFASLLYISTLGIINYYNLKLIRNIYDILYQPIIESNSLHALNCLARISTRLQLDSITLQIFDQILESFSRLKDGIILSSATLGSYGHQATHVLFLHLLRTKYDLRIQYSKLSLPKNINQSLLSIQDSLAPNLFVDVPATHCLNEFLFFPSLLSRSIQFPAYQSYRTSYYDYAFSFLLETSRSQNLLGSLTPAKQSEAVKDSNSIFVSIRTSTYKNDIGCSDHRNQDMETIVEAMNQLAKLYPLYNFNLFSHENALFSKLPSNFQIIDPTTSFDHILSIQRKSKACIIPGAGAAWAAALYFQIPTLAYDSWPCDVGKYSHPSLTYHFRSASVNSTPASIYRLNQASGHSERYSNIIASGVSFNSQRPEYYTKIFQAFINKVVIHSKHHYRPLLSHHPFFTL